MTGWLLDTNVLSELRRAKPNPNVVSFVAAKSLDLLFVSIVTFAEIRFGIEQVADVTRRAELNDWLTHKVRPMASEGINGVSCRDRTDVGLKAVTVDNVDRAIE